MAWRHVRLWWPEHAFPGFEGEGLQLGWGLVQELTGADGDFILARIRAASIGEPPHATLATVVDATVQSRCDRRREERMDHRLIQILAAGDDPHQRRLRTREW